MNKYEAIVALFSMATGGAMFVVLVTSWFRYREKSLERTANPPQPLQEQRLARIETAVEAIAEQVERISEGQRFTTKLLSERQGAIAAPAAGQALAQREGHFHGT